MLSSLATLVDNLYEGLHSDKCTDCKSCLKYIVTKDELLIFNCLKYSKSNKRHFNKDLIKRFAIIYDFCDGDINKFILLSRKGIYPYEYMDSWERFDETFLPDKEDFYSDLNMKDITDADYMYAKKIWKIFKIKNLGDYHDLYIQSDTSFIAGVFQNFRSLYLKIYELDPALISTRISMASIFKKD